MSVRDVVILGSGPAGLTAAIYTARADLQPLVIAGRQAGGQLMLTTEVENFPGFPEGIMGPELMDRFRKQATRFGATLIPGNVTRVNVRQRPFALQYMNFETGEHVNLLTQTLIVATGASAKYLGI